MELIREYRKKQEAKGRHIKDVTLSIRDYNMYICIVSVEGGYWSNRAESLQRSKSVIINVRLGYITLIILRQR